MKVKRKMKVEMILIWKLINEVKSTIKFIFSLQMPTDSRRIAGPESSVPYSVYLANKQKEKSKERVGRALDSHRKIFLKTDVISQAKGSSYVEQGGTKVMVGVYGPREVWGRTDFQKGTLQAEFKFAPFACASRRGHQADREEEELGIVLSESLASAVCLQKYSKSCIDVYVTVLEDDGSVLAASITAAGLALADAGIQMYDLVVGACVCLREGEMLVDPSAGELCGVGASVVTLGYLPSLEQVVACVGEGTLATQTMQQAIAQATQQAALILPAIQQCLVEKLKKAKLTQPQP